MLSRLCVGAASRIVVEEAAKLQVAQIVASRRQVNAAGGYIDMTPRVLVEVVRELSNGKTEVVRDHGGPLQGGFSDDGIADFDECVTAEFDALHLDVSALPREDQLETLAKLIRRYRNIDLEVGGERDDQAWLDTLSNAVSTEEFVKTVVVDVGGHAWEDRQCGSIASLWEVEQLVQQAHGRGLKAKAHNMDWVGRRGVFFDLLDYLNIAPEYGAVEIDAWLRVMSKSDAEAALGFAYDTGHWRRWFDDGQGDWDSRARCALRYVISGPDMAEIMGRVSKNEDYVRERVHDAITRT